MSLFNNNLIVLSISIQYKEIPKRSSWPIDWTLTSPSTPGRSKPDCNNKGFSLHSSDIQTQSFTARCMDYVSFSFSLLQSRFVHFLIIPSLVVYLLNCFLFNFLQVYLESKLATVVEGVQEGSLFNSYYTEV